MAEHDAHRDRWAARPGLSFVVRAVATVGPLVVAVATSYGLGSVLPPPVTIGAAVWRFLLLSGVATLVLFLLDRASRRLLPLAALLRLNLAFPGSAPSRYRVARASAGTRDLTADVEAARAMGVDDDRTRAAEAVLRLVSVLSLHDRATRGHAERTRVLTDMIAAELELEQHDMDRLRWAALVHDVGKVVIHPDILNKAGAPDEDEWEELRRHPIEGARLTAPLREWLGEWALTIEQHHERWDGGGYPHGLSGHGIGLGARIVAVADAFDVMTAARAYRAAVPAAEARAELAQGAGTQFDPMVVRAFLAIPLDRLRAAMGPLSWLAHLPVLRPLSQVPAVVGSGTAVIAATLGMVTYGSFVELPVADEATVAASAGAPTPATPLPDAIVRLEPQLPVAPVNGPPVLGRVVVITEQDTAVVVDLAAAATDPDGDAITVVSAGADTGAVEIDGARRTVTFTPATGWVGDARISYVLTDGIHEVVGDAVVSVAALVEPAVASAESVTAPSAPPTHRPEPAQPAATTSVAPRPPPPAPRPPTPVDDTARLDEDTSVTLDLLANDTDPDGDTLSVVALETAALRFGSLEDNGDGTVRYVPRPDANGTDALRYRVSDGEHTATATARFVVRPVADAPVAADDTYAAETRQLTVSAVKGLLANDRDADGDRLVVDTRSVEGPPAGQARVIVAADGSFELTAQGSWSGVTRFTYAVSDGGLVDVATVTVRVPPPTQDAAAAGLYLTGERVDGSTSRMSSKRPAGGSVPDWDGDGEPGLTIEDSGQKEDEDDPKKFHEWLYVLERPMQLDGPVAMTLTSAVAEFEGDEDVDYTVFVYTCDGRGRSCSLLAGTRDKHVENWNRQGQWSTRTVPVGNAKANLAAGSSVRVKLMFHHEDVWLALTGDRASYLSLTTSGGALDR